VFRLVTNSVMEERILARATDKRNLTGLVVEAGKFNRTEDEDGGDRKAMMEALLKEYSEGLEFEEDGDRSFLSSSLCDLL
jgi:ATP-dependent helicase STH1/SNF2